MHALLSLTGCQWSDPRYVVMLSEFGMFELLSSLSVARGMSHH